MSKYLIPGYGVEFDENIARRYQPQIMDPYSYSHLENPKLYYRVVKKGDEKCIEYFYYWREQDCRRSYMFTDKAVVSLITGLILAVLTWLVINLWAYFIHTVSLLMTASIILLFFLVGGGLGYRWSARFSIIFRPMTVIQKSL